MTASRRVEEADTLLLSFLLVLEGLRPVERSVFVLHDILRRSHAETARMVGVSESICRQLLVQARHAMRVERDRIEAERTESAELVERFRAAVREGDVSRIASLLAPDAVAYLRVGPVVGRDAVAARLGRSNFDPILSIETSGGVVQAVRIAA